jgi:hypothetical protein
LDFIALSGYFSNRNLEDFYWVAHFEWNLAKKQKTHRFSFPGKVLDLSYASALIAYLILWYIIK